MANNDKRLNYFNGQFLQDTDFQTEQAYLLDRQRRHNRLMHTFGIAEGLAVSASAGASTVGVTPGSAIDGQGRQIVLFDPRTLQLGAQSPFVGKTVLVVIAYAEAPSDPAQVGGSGNTRTWESPDVRLVVDDGTAPAPDASLRLARLKLDGGGLVSGNPDLSVRVTAGARVGSEVDVPILKLQTPGVDASLWPAFTSNAAGEADLAGNLVVNGTAKISGALSAGGATVNALTVSGAASAASLNVSGTSALTGLNVSGTSALTGLNVSGSAVLAGLTVSGSSVLAGLTASGSASLASLAVSGSAVISGRTISADGTKLDSHVANTSNPHNVTATQVGAITGVGGVANPGGAVSLLAGGAIVLTPDNSSNKRITISESHSAVTGNPHATLASQLSDYDFGKKSITSVYFNQSDADGATRTLTLGFQPRFVWLSGGAGAYTAANQYMGGTISGFCDLRSGNNSNGTAINAIRFGTAPYGTTNANSSSYLGYLYYFDGTVSPIQYIYYYATITVINATGLVVTFNRYTPTGGSYAPPSSFYLSINLACVG